MKSKDKKFIIFYIDKTTPVYIPDFSLFDIIFPFLPFFSLCLTLSHPVFLFLCLFLCLSVSVSLCLCLSLCLFISLSVFLSLFFYLSTSLSLFLAYTLFSYLFSSLSLFLISVSIVLFVLKKIIYKQHQ